jgi:hypothetical protein
VYHEICYLVAHRSYPYIAGSLLLSVLDVYSSLTENCNTYCLLPFASLFTVSLTVYKLRAILGESMYVLLLSNS